MFHKLLTYSTMTAVVLHALLGCCVHHAHADHTHGLHVEAVAAMVQHDHACDGHSHHHDSDLELPQLGGDDSGNEPCSGSHGPHECCDEPDCNIVADQRENDIDLLKSIDWSPVLTSNLSLSSQDVFALRTEAGSPPDPHAVLLSLHAKNQVWRI